MQAGRAHSASQKLHERVRVERPGAAERDEGEVARVMAALDRDKSRPLSIFSFAMATIARGPLRGDGEALGDLADGRAAKSG